uniref:Uncharacterized protein n=1 Tax=Ciona intestinalis TaxID=7719 RepID=H2Y2R5_CIOIN
MLQKMLNNSEKCRHTPSLNRGMTGGYGTFYLLMVLC